MQQLQPHDPMYLLPSQRRCEGQEAEEGGLLQLQPYGRLCIYCQARGGARGTGCGRSREVD